MRTGPTLFIVVLVISLVSMQFSGLHMHVNADGNGGLHGAHAHEADHDGHGHEGDTDVSLVELGAGWAKLLPFLIPFAFIMLAVIQSGNLVWAPISCFMYSRDRSRWRPPLRAPPIAVS